MNYDTENKISNRHVLLYLVNKILGDDMMNDELTYLKSNFCGVVVNNIDDMKPHFSPDRIIYFCGDVNNVRDLIKNEAYLTFRVIKEFSENYEENTTDYHVEKLGKVPINVHNAGIYFRDFFDGKDYFNSIKNEHVFQTLSESNKPGNAFRKGIYLSEVKNINEKLHFKLLRCSSNLRGPTDNFRKTDRDIIFKLNNISQHFFEEKTELNHVLAQIYENSDQGKAKIKAHSDKTKDMPHNGLIAFCTFYDDKIKTMKKSKTDIFDYCYNSTSVLTQLHFKLKSCVENDKLVKEFNVTLYPNSVFIIPLSTNRLYTHDVRPSILPFDHIPTRMGYVVRCSKTNAVSIDNQTYIVEKQCDLENEYVKLQPITEQNITDLRALYYEENMTDKIMSYGNIYYSMNDGDYLTPNV